MLDNEELEEQAEGEVALSAISSELFSTHTRRRGTVPIAGIVLEVHRLWAE